MKTKNFSDYLKKRLSTEEIDHIKIEAKKDVFEIEYEISSGNVWQDLGFTDAEERLNKAKEKIFK